MKKTSKHIGFCMAVILAAGSLTGCISGKSVSEKEILLWSSATGPDGEAIKKTIERYNDTAPSMKVKFVSMEAETFNSKLTTVGKSGKGVPDLALVSSESLPAYHRQNMLESWDDAISETEVKEKNYIAGTWEAGHIGGKQYGVPATMGSWIMYVNKDLAQKYVPGCLDDGFITYAEIEAAGEQAKKEGKYAIATTWNMQNYMNVYQQTGGEWTDQSGKIRVDNEHSYEALGIYKKFHDNGWLVPQGEDAGKLFVNGDVVFLPEGTWMLSMMQTITEFQWTETFTPQVNLEHIVQCAGADQFVVFHSKKERSSEKIKAMTDFLVWLQSNQMEWCASGAIPSGIAMSQNEDFLKMPQSFLLTSEKGRDHVRINTTEGTSYVFSEVDARAWDMINGTADITETFDEIQKIVDEKMGY